MIRLINANELIKYIPSEEPLSILAVANAPTVEAIPIEYIQHWIDKKNYGRRNGKMMLAKALNELIAEWRKEHETD